MSGPPQPNDFFVWPGVWVDRWDPYELEKLKSSYGDYPVGQVLHELRQTNDHRSTIKEIMGQIDQLGDLTYALVICRTHWVFVDGRHRLAAAIDAGMSSVPVVYRCYC